VSVEVALGGDHDAVALPPLDRLTNHLLGAIGCGGVEEVDAKIEGLAHQCHRLRLAEAGAEPDAAVSPTAEPRNADPKARLPKRGIVHGNDLSCCGPRRGACGAGGRAAEKVGARVNKDYGMSIEASKLAVPGRPSTTDSCG